MIVRRFALFLVVAGSGLVAPAQEPARTTRQELVVTNQNLGLVLESRTVSLPAGRTELVWEGAPAAARTETWAIPNAREAGVRWLGLTAPTPGMGTSEAEWLAGLIGKRVRIQRPGGTTVEGVVLAVHGPTPAQVVFREGNEIVYGEPDARISVASDVALRQRPAGVILLLESERAGSRTLTSRYLVNELSWEAAYALTLTPDEKRGRLEGWFVLDNRTGAEFAPSRLRLLAGTLRTAPPPAPRPGAMARMETMAAAQDASAESVELSESRIYEVEAPPRLAAGRTTFPLAAGADVAVDKRYLVRSHYWMGVNEEPQRVPVAVLYRVDTKPLDRALPMGIVRVYAESGSVFTGEDGIPHTAERTDIEIETSEAFDLSARRRQTSFTQVSRFESEAAYEVVLTSRKKDAVTVLVRENFPGDWTIVQSSVPARKVSAFVAEFAVPVPAGGETKLTYRVRVRLRG